MRAWAELSAHKLQGKEGAAGPGKESPEQPSGRRGHMAQPVTGSRQGAREKQVSTGARSSPECSIVS